MKWKRLIIATSVLLVLTTLVLYITRLPGGEKITKKKHLIATKLEEKGYHGGYIIISEKRHKWYNSLLTNSVDRSYHMKGMAVDFWLMDLNDDGKWDKKDIELMVKIIGEVEKDNPELKGWTGTYLSKGALSSRMVHTDVSGIANPKNKTK
ncbi:hypothetical protein ACFLRY_05750 [Bacteroidota bacterium]